MKMLQLLYAGALITALALMAALNTGCGTMHGEYIAPVPTQVELYPPVYEPSVYPYRICSQYPTYRPYRPYRPYGPTHFYHGR